MTTTDRTFRFNTDQQGLRGDAIIELFEIDLLSSNNAPPRDGRPWRNARAICEIAPPPTTYFPSDVVNDQDISICTDAPNYNSPEFNAGFALYDNADLIPRNEIQDDTEFTTFYFCNWVVTDGVPVTFAGEIYTPVPYKAEGFQIRNEGVLPNPRIVVANVGLEFTALINTYDDLLGAKVIRRRVLARHLDTGSDPDDEAQFPPETWFIQQKVEESKLTVTFELSTPFDLDGLTLPKRRALRYQCPWLYRGAECTYNGPPVANAKDQPTSSTEEDKCGKRVTSCRLRFGNDPLPYGGFPGLTL